MAARVPCSAGSGRALPELDRRSGFSFQSVSAKDTSISEATPSSMQRTGSRDGPHTSRSPPRQRNRSRGNGRFQGSLRSHADRGLRVVRRLSSPQSYRNADQRHTDGDHRKARGPRSKPGATPKRISAHEQHSDGNSVGEAQRQSRVADENERNDDRERRQEAEQADADRAEPVALRQSRTLGLGQLEQSLPHQFELVRPQDRPQHGWQRVRDDAMRVSDIGGRAHSPQLHGVAPSLVEASHQKHAGVDDSPGQVTAECGEEHGPNLDAVWVTTPRVKVKVSAIIKPNRTSEILSIGSRIRSDDLAQNGASGSAAVWIGSFSIPVTDADAARPIHLT